MSTRLTFRGADYVAYQKDTVRVYLSYWFQVALNYTGGDIQSFKDDHERLVEDLGSLFADGRLTGEMFLESLYGTRTSGRSVDRALVGCLADSLEQELASYEGPLLKILMVTKSVDEVSQEAVYDIRATVFKWEDGWGSMLLFTVKAGEGGSLQVEYEGQEI